MIKETKNNESLQIKMGVILSYVAIAANALGTLFATKYIIFKLGVSESGVYNEANSVITYLSILGFGLSATYIKFYTKYRVNKDSEGLAKLNGLYIKVFSVIGSVIILAGIGFWFVSGMIFHKFTSHELYELNVMITVLCINMAVSFPTGIFESYITANERYIFIKSLWIANVVIIPLAQCLVVYFGGGPISIVVITTIYQLGRKIVDYSYCKKYTDFRVSFKGTDFGLLKEIFVFNFFIFLTTIVDQINWNLDRVIIGAIKGAAAITIYHVASQFNAMINTLAVNISAVFIPKINRLAINDGEEETNNLFVRIGRIQYIVVGLVISGMVIYGKEFLTLFYGEKFDKSYIILLFLCIPSIIVLIQSAGIEIQRAKNMHKFMTYVYLGMSLINLILSIVLCNKYSGAGCAFATGLSLVIGNGIVLNWYYHKKIGINIIEFWKNIVKMTPSILMPAAIAFFVKKYFPVTNLFLLIVYGAIYACIYSGFVFVLGMNQSERQLITGVINKAIKRK